MHVTDPLYRTFVSQGYGIEISLFWVYLGLLLGDDEKRTCGWPDDWVP